MRPRELKNVPASVRARLLNEARASGDSYDQVLQYFAIERFLYRLAQTEWADRLIVKGAIMLRAWGTPLWLLPTLRTYEGPEVSAALSATFSHRGTAMPTEVPPGLTNAFFGEPDNQAAWRSFLSNRRVEAPSDLEDVCEAIIAFMMPPAAAAASGPSFSSTWSPSSGWLR